MRKIRNFIEKYKLIIALSVFIMCLVLIFSFILSRKNIDTNIDTVDSIAKIDEIEKVNKIENLEEPLEEVEKARVDIKGFVEEPGVYEVENNFRVIDVINKAGGLKEGANTEYINLSKKVTDEMIIIIYSNDELEKFKEIEKEVIYIEYECVCPDNINDACIDTSDTVNTNGNKDNLEDSTVNTSDTEDIFEDDSLISINTATLEELMTLIGIGESKAQAIISYREENGNFESLEEIMNVSGIGEAAYSKIKNNIKL